jgi:hypothetical protein
MWDTVGDKLEPATPPYTVRNLPNKVCNIKTGRLSPAKGFTMLFKGQSSAHGEEVKVIL